MRRSVVLLIAAMLGVLGGVDVVRGGSYVVPALNCGWFRGDGLHQAANTNYVTGEINNRPAPYRSFFLFDLSGVTLSAGETITGVSIAIPTLFVTTGDPTETVTFYDLSTPAATLASDSAVGSAAGIAAYNDLGGGATFGSQSYTVADGQTFQIKTIALNANALTSLGAAGHGAFGVGGALTTLEPAVNDETVYGSGGALPPDEIILTITTSVPEPAILAPLALLTVIIRRRGCGRP